MKNQKVWRAICLVLSGWGNQVEWGAFTPQEWGLLWRMACAEGVAPLLYHKLDPVIGDLRLPEETRQQLSAIQRQAEGEYYRSTAQNQLLFHELGRIVAKLEEQGIAAILLKGAALAPALYEDLGTRPMHDLDLLARQEEIDRASGILQQLGYHEHYPPQLGMPRAVDQAIAHERHLRGGPGGELAVELHWNLIAGAADRRAPPQQWPWEERIPFESARLGDQAGMPLRSWALSPTASLLYAAAHLMLQHGSQARLLWNYDLHLILTRWGEAIRWAELPKIAGEFHWADALSLALQNTQACFATPLPEGFLESLAPFSDPATRRIIALRAAEEDELKAILLLTPQVYRLPTRIRLALAAAFPSPAYMRWRYHPRPTWAWPLYYFVRASKFVGYKLKSVKFMGNKSL